MRRPREIEQKNAKRFYVWNNACRQKSWQIKNRRESQAKKKGRTKMKGTTVHLYTINKRSGDIRIPKNKVLEGGRLNIKLINFAVNAFRLKGGSEMSLKSRLKIENVGMLAAFAFYAVVGIVCIAVLAIVDFRLVHVGLIGILSLITAFGFVKNRFWTLWFVVALFFIATTFSASILYSAFEKDLLLDVSMVAYLLLTWVFTVYTATKRRALES